MIECLLALKLTNEYKRCEEMKTLADINELFVERVEYTSGALISGLDDLKTVARLLIHQSLIHLYVLATAHIARRSEKVDGTVHVKGNRTETYRFNKLYTISKINFTFSIQPSRNASETQYLYIFIMAMNALSPLAGRNDDVYKGQLFFLSHFFSFFFLLSFESIYQIPSACPSDCRCLIVLVFSPLLGERRT